MKAKAALPQPLTSPSNAARGKQPRSVRRRVLFVALYLLYLAVLVWLGAKFYGWYRFGIPLTKVHQKIDVWQTYYPEVWKTGLYDARLSPGDETFDVLMLGASVLEKVSDEFEDKLRAEFGGNVRLFNVAKSAHTSRDSLFKFRLVRDKPFDLIVIYHGINDTRMNCCPPGEFKDDYTHCDWYANMQRRLVRGDVTVAELIAEDLLNRIPLGIPEEASLDYGKTIKTQAAFRTNFEEILKEASARNVPVMLMSFAYYLPENYTRERYKAGELDYGDEGYQMPVEVWGRPAHVAAAIDVHNQILARLARRYDNVIEVDQRTLLPPGGGVFSDPCHFTPAGRRAFVENMLAALRKRPGIFGNAE